MKQKKMAKDMEVKEVEELLEELNKRIKQVNEKIRRNKNGKKR